VCIGLAIDEVARPVSPEGALAYIRAARAPRQTVPDNEREMTDQQCTRHDELNSNNFHDTPFPDRPVRGRAVYVSQVTAE